MTVYKDLFMQHYTIKLFTQLFNFIWDAWNPLKINLGDVLCFT